MSLVCKPLFKLKNGLPKVLIASATESNLNNKFGENIGLLFFSYRFEFFNNSLSFKRMTIKTYNFNKYARNKCICLLPL